MSPALKSWALGMGVLVLGGGLRLTRGTVGVIGLVEYDGRGAVVVDIGSYDKGDRG